MHQIRSIIDALFQFSNTNIGTVTDVTICRHSCYDSEYIIKSGFLFFRRLFPLQVERSIEMLNFLTVC